MSTAIDGVFSIRLVIADFYLQKPIMGLDTCYSEFRGKEVKRVPIIRIFGSTPTAEGRKTCMHIHGVFPYFYIPYVKKDFESLQKAVYLIATNLDKAINISLGQGNAMAQHVFKVQLVKGIPFYGYHRNEHQFLKIYMYNPRFVRRAANLLQNGVIMNKVFNPCEAHVPYILQFMIDYNLYAMSLLHVPFEVVKFRRSNEDEPVLVSNVHADQLLCPTLANKLSTCAVEVDINSNFILNRFQLLHHQEQKNSNANPGIEAIWHDERIRRQKMMAACMDSEEEMAPPPPLEVPPSQDRPAGSLPTESDIFYRTALLAKLTALDASSSNISHLDDTTLNATAMEGTNNTLNGTVGLSTAACGGSDVKEQRRKFNLSKLLVNAVYPEECTQPEEGALINASYIENHFSGRSSSNAATPTSLKESETYEGDLFDKTVLDEELVLSLTQGQYKEDLPEIPLDATLRDEDMELLDILQHLEEQNDDRLQPVDLDSTLAPLSQPKELPGGEIAPNDNPDPLETRNNEDDEETANVDEQDFSMAIDDIDELLLQLTQSQCERPKAEAVVGDIAAGSPQGGDNVGLPQLDGADDQLPQTPRKRNHAAISSSQLPMQQRTPRSRMQQSQAQASPLSRTQQSSPRTPKLSTAHKYAPLPIVISSRNKTTINGEKEATSSPLRHVPATRLAKARVMLGERLDLSGLRRRSIEEEHVAAEPAVEENTKKTRGKRKGKRAATIPATETGGATETTAVPTKSLAKDGGSAIAEASKRPMTRRSAAAAFNADKTRITCSLTPRRSSKRLLKVYKLQQDGAAGATEIVSQTEDEDKLLPPGIQEEETNQVPLHPPGTQEKEAAQGPLQLPGTPEKEIDQLPLQPSGTPAKETEHMPLQPPPTREKETEEVSPSIEAARNSSNTANQNNEDDFIMASDAEDESMVVEYEVENTRQSPQRTPDPSQSSPKPPAENRKGISLLIQQLRNLAAATAAKNAGGYKPVKDDQAHLKEIVKEETKSVEETIERTISEIPDSPQPAAVNDWPANMGRLQVVEEEGDDGILIQRFYDHSFTHSPSVFSEGSGPSFSAPGTPSLDLHAPPEIYRWSPSDVPSTSAAARLRQGKQDFIILTPMDLPPTYDEAVEGCRKLDLPENEYQQPFYNNPEDVMHRREVGHIVLHIRSNKLNDLLGFESVLQATMPNWCGVNAWRRQLLRDIGETAPPADGRLQELLVREQCMQLVEPLGHLVIEPHLEPPTRQEAKMWLKVRELLAAQAGPGVEGNALEEDSPIKVRRQKISMILPGDGGGDEDGDCTASSITLTPMTPLTPVARQADSDRVKEETNETPRTVASPLLTLGSMRRNRRRDRARLSLSTRLLKAATSAALTPTQEDPNEDCTEKPPSLPASPSELQTLSQSTEGSSVSSQQALAELERASFRQQLAGRAIIVGGSPADELSFGLSNATLDNTFGFKVKLENLQDAKADIEYNHLTIINLEVFVATRGDLYPNPTIDALTCLFYAIEHSVPPKVHHTTPHQTPTGSKLKTEDDKRNSVQDDSLPTKACGCIIVHDESDPPELLKSRHGLDADIEVLVVRTEMEAIEALLSLCNRWDADIYAGYQIETASWGYVMERAKHLGIHIAPLLSRVPTQKVRDFVDDDDRGSYTDLDFEMKLAGRILLDVWRLMRSEIALTSYTFENVVYHILHRRCPHHSYRALTQWWQTTSTRWIVMEYHLERVRGTLALLDQLDLLGRTSEMAKLIGIQFYEVFSRGSQFRVESMMLRMAKPRNLVPLSPSVKQRAHMRAPEYLALILEPHSRFYADPVVVLDFQSLYPSIIIAYNYCFSTCLGRVEHLGQSSPFEFAASQLRVSPTLLRQLLDRDLVTFSPCGVCFVRNSVREGILPRMLTEILNTRIMVKQSMKVHARRTAGDALQRILHSRQLGLKLMANVTYGYTAANFSGRMPAVEVGDSVVAKGRETLERAIKLVEANGEWRARVVYGDTDSMFVLLPGRSRAEAFVIGEQIAEAVTQANPAPIKLKLEKVYQPCLLQTKKRYVGNMFETADQATGTFEAKGIETVRRDGCPAAAKMLEKVLRLLFETADVSSVKRYVCRQFAKLLSGRANLQDLVFAKEFRGLNGYKPTAVVPALELTRKWLQNDPCRVPRSGERVPYVIVNGPPGVQLIRLVRSPHELLADPGLHINAFYYIKKAIIPPLNRCLLLIGADAHEWFASLPRKILLTTALGVAPPIEPLPQSAIAPPLASQAHQKKSASSRALPPKKSTISQYFTTSSCLLDCGGQAKEGICDSCRRHPLRCIVLLQEKAAKLERRHVLTQQVCAACCGRGGGADAIRCSSLDCPVLYVSVVKSRELQQLPLLRRLIEQF